MQKKLNRLILLSLILLLVVPGCTKYEFGPGFSLRTKKGRISNFWVIEEAYLNGELDTAKVLPRFSVEINRDETFIYYDSLTNVQGGDSVAVITGTWGFIEDAEQVVLVGDLPATVQEVYLWEILRLAGDEFWFEERDQNLDVYEYHMIPQ